MAELSDLVQAGESSIAQIVEALDGIDFNAMASDMSDEKVGVRRKNSITREISDLTRGLYAFELAIREGTKNPDVILSGYEAFLLNYNTKGKDMNPGYVAKFAKRLGKHRGTLRRYSNSRRDTHESFHTQEEKYTIQDVRKAFKEVGDIFDPNNLGQVVDALNMAYRTPRLTEVARDNFGPGWFNVGVTVFELKRGLTSLDELREKQSPYRRLQEAAVILNYHLTVSGHK